ncbi:MAG: phosphate acyltransferase PlsX [Xanthomonadaceae bacterium]|nr:phosphate acyltransferase PlsX [Xanthomonadaceae bacterium]
MTRAVTIALDAMGGDHGPSVVVPAAAQILRRHSQVKLILVGDEQVLKQHLAQQRLETSERLQIHHASQVVGMDELPSHALRNKKDSSMRVAINLVKEGVADACVSAGNTGALMATARFVLKTLPGVDRPAITALVPTRNGFARLLDLGANVDCSADHLLQFAVMGAVLAEAIDGKPNPRVGLLNIGEEEIKGNDQIKQAARLLSESNLNYIGYVEGDGIFKGVADVIVCDGLVGNVALKTMEGVGTVIAEFMREEFSRNLFTKLAGLAALPVLRALQKRIDSRGYNGGSLLGLRGIVVKSHGSADAYSYSRAIDVAILEVERAVPTRIDQHLADMLVKEQSL